MNSSAVVYTARVPEKRNRLTVFFRLILLIPLVVVGAFYAIGAMFAVIAAWFALLFTGRYPPGLYNFVGGVLQFSARVNGYCYLQVDQYPPFSLGPDDSYPVQLNIPEPKEKYSRAKVFFRVIVGIPVMIIGYALGIVAEVMAVVVWLVAIVAGRTSEGLHSALNLGVSYGARYSAYFALITEDWPSITDTDGGGIQVDDGGAAAAAPDPFGRPSD